MAKLLPTFVAGCFSVLILFAACGMLSAADVEVSGSFSAPITRYIPITPGDLMYSGTMSAGDAGIGVVFPPPQQNGGTITFPVPADYIPGTQLHLDLYLSPNVTTTGTIDFFVRWAGVSDGGWSGTGPSVTSTPVTPGSSGFLIKQSFVLNGFNTPLPEIIMLTIRRNPADTFGAAVTLTALRLSYQASR